MDVKQLKEILDNYSDDTEVMTACPSHDHWRTMLAGRIGGLEETAVTWSAYHNTFQVLTDDDDGDDRDFPADGELVLLIS